MDRRVTITENYKQWPHKHWCFKTVGPSFVSYFGHWQRPPLLKKCFSWFRSPIPPQLFYCAGLQKSARCSQVMEKERAAMIATLTELDQIHWRHTIGPVQQAHPIITQTKSSSITALSCCHCVWMGRHGFSILRGIGRRETKQNGSNLDAQRLGVSTESFEKRKGGRVHCEKMVKNVPKLSMR